MERFLELLKQLEADIASMSTEELNEARAEINAYGLELAAGADETEDKAALAEDAKALGEALKSIDAELATRAEADAAASAVLDEAFSAFTAEEEATEETGEEETAAEEPAAEEEAADLATAPALSDIAARRPRQPAPEPEPAEPAQPVVAAAVGEEGTGIGFDRNTFARAMYDAQRHSARGGGRRSVARVELPTQYNMGADPEANWAILQDMQREFQLARQRGETPEALVAAGFCAPAEPVYDFFQQGSRDGIIQLPQVTAGRGRLTYPAIYGIRDLQVEDGVGFEYTAQMDEDEVEKPCYQVDCVDGVTYEVAGTSTCLEFSNFDSQFYPERVTHISGQSLIAHDHELNLRLIDDIVADARTETVIDAGIGGGTWANVVQSVALHAGFIRNRLRLPLGTVMEVGFPSVGLDALVADQVSRDSTTEYGMVQAQIEAALRRAGVNVQWLYDWQEPGHPNWPATVDYLMWPAGAVVQLSGGTLDLGVTRDSVLNVANDFQIFVETFDGIAIIGDGVFNVTGLEICPTGATGDRAALACAAGS